MSGRKHKYNARKAYRCPDCGGAALTQDNTFCVSCSEVVVPLKFDSQAEARRYDQLMQMRGRKAGDIAPTSIQRQRVFPLYAVSPKGGAGGQVGKYVADFAYRRIPGELVVEDVKGMDTPLSKWKRKHCELQYGIKIEVIKA